MKPISSPMQFKLVALGYAAVFMAAATLLYGRHLQELRYPEEASGGMWAAGDAMLYIFNACLFMVPTFFLIVVTAKFEAFYTAYTKFLLALSLSAPICLGVFLLGKIYVGETFLNLCFERLLCSLFILTGMGFSRWAARFDRAKRFASSALVIEGLTLVTAVALLIHSLGGPRNH